MVDARNRAKARSRPLSVESEFEKPERYSRDGSHLVRTLQLRNGEVVRTVASHHGTTVPAILAGDGGADWDKSFLCGGSSGPWEAGRGHVVVVDLFSGVGGMSLGVREACRALGLGFEVARACDLDEEALATYNNNFGARTADAFDLNGLSSILGSTKTPVEVQLTRAVDCRPDVLVAGPPCQGHSNLNNHTRRDDPKNELYFKVARAAELLRPRIVLVENVPTVTKDVKRVVPRTAEALRHLGYEVDHGVVDLTRLGVAQTRKRHVLVARLLAPGGSQPPQGTLSVEDTIKRFEAQPRTVRWAIGDLFGKHEHEQMDSLPELSPITRRRIDYLFQHKLYDLPDRQRPDCHRDGDHTYQSVYGRMRWDLPSPTITSGFFTMGRGRFVHPQRKNVLTAREAARLQFFPDNFDWSGVNTRGGLARAIGNAVPPKLSYVFLAELLR
jgi:DNA (cytosine-5)-methyltransferase 1